jgi:hypothetical protein
MTEKDFVYAWLLATRAGGDEAWGGTPFRIHEAKEIYKLIQQECSDETDSRTED